MQPLRLLGYHRDVCDVMHVECGCSGNNVCSAGGTCIAADSEADGTACSADDELPDRTPLSWHGERDRQGLLRRLRAPALPHVETQSVQ